jgi:hypothetical protein
MVLWVVLERAGLWVTWGGRHSLLSFAPQQWRSRVGDAVLASRLQAPVIGPGAGRSAVRGWT